MKFPQLDSAKAAGTMDIEQRDEDYFKLFLDENMVETYAPLTQVFPQTRLVT